MRIIGINGFNRMSKLLFWYLLKSKYFDQFVINLGPRNHSYNNDFVINEWENDSLHGNFRDFLNLKSTEIEIKRNTNLMTEFVLYNNNFKNNKAILKFVFESFNPREINWNNHNVPIVIDTNISLADPSHKINDKKHSYFIRGHFSPGVKLVFVTAPFLPQPAERTKQAFTSRDLVTLVKGINENDFDPKFHRIISTSDSTTTFLSHMLKPLFFVFGDKNFLSASATIIKSASEFIDYSPDNHSKNILFFDNNFNLSDNIEPIFDSIESLKQVMPVFVNKGIMIESITIPLQSGTLIILVTNIHRSDDEIVKKDKTNKFFNDLFALFKHDYVSDYISVDFPQTEIKKEFDAKMSPIKILGKATHTRTADIYLDELISSSKNKKTFSSNSRNIIIPVTQTVLYGWVKFEIWNYAKISGDTIIFACDRISSF